VNRDQYETIDSGKLVLVHIIDPVLIQSYGPRQYYGWETALRGERMGKWILVRKQDFSSPNSKYNPVLSRSFSGDIFSKMLPDWRRYSWKERKWVGVASEVNEARVAWVQDFLKVGGAELSCETAVRVGRALGFGVDVITGETPVEIFDKILKSARLAVINNIIGLSTPHHKVLIEHIWDKNLPYIKWEHDHRELLRPYFSRKLFHLSRMNVFLSPLHLENHMQKLSIEGVALPLAIDPDQYQADSSVERKPNTALVCNVRNFKTWNNLQKFIRDHADWEFWILSGNGSLPVEGGNVRRIPKVPPNEMPKLYSQVEYVVHLLDGYGAGERVVIEGALCGAKIITNERVGHASWGWEWNDRDFLSSQLIQALRDFWKIVEREIQ